MSSFNPKIYNSLQYRYLALAVLLGLIILACIGVAQHYVARAGQHSARNIEARNHTIQRTLLIKNDLLKAEYALDLYMLSPSADARNTFNRNVDRTLDHVGTVVEMDWIKKNRLVDKTEALRPSLLALREQAGELMEVRLNGNAMYPAMKLANGSMLVAHHETQTAIDLAISETREEMQSEHDPVYLLLVDLRNAWNRQISAYRLYLINRLGSLFEDALEAQATDVDLQHRRVMELLKQLGELDQLGMTGLETSDAINTISQTAPVWYDDYKHVLGINTTENWRSDIPLIRNVIQPLLIDIRGKLEYLDVQLGKSSTEDVAAQINAVSFMIRTLWAVALFVMLFVLLGYVIFNRKLLRPIAQIARNLRDEAAGCGDGTLPDVNSGEMRYLVDAFSEMRKQVHSRQMALEDLAMHDSLTGLPNRVLLLDRLNLSTAAARRDARSLAVIMIDLDRFKEINDTLGHHTGDLLLKQVAVRLDSALREADTVARLGGDEFAILLPDVDETYVSAVASKLLDIIEQVYEVNEHSLYIGASVGVALFPQHGTSAETLIQHADVAMYASKRSNGSVTVYDVDKDTHSVTQLSVLTDLRQAIDNDALELYYQPKVARGAGDVIGVEALLRWNHPQQGLIMPDLFIPAAEQTGLIRRITHWVIDDALRQCSTWLAQGSELAISVNLSVWDLHDSNLDRRIQQSLDKWRVPHRLLELEITESAMMVEPERARELLHRLGAMGVRLSIDDYGTGYSSLSYLKQLPVNTLKIDKSFVLNMITDENDRVIVRSTIELAHNLGIEVIAEGVENKETWTLLERLRCDYMQGYYIGRPQTVSQLEDWLESKKTNLETGEQFKSHETGV